MGSIGVRIFTVVTGSHSKSLARLSRDFCDSASLSPAWSLLLVINVTDSYQRRATCGCNVYTLMVSTATATAPPFADTFAMMARCESDAFGSCRRSPPSSPLSSLTARNGRHDSHQRALGRVHCFVCVFVGPCGRGRGQRARVTAGGAGAWVVKHSLSGRRTE